MDWSDVGKKIMDLSPGIGLALGGPGGAALGSILASTFGSGQSPDEVGAAISANPEAMVKLKEVQLRHEGLIATLASRRYEALLLDVQDARKQHKDHWMPAALTITLVMMVSSMLAGLFYLTVPEGNKDVVYLIVGQIIGSFSASIAYWIGSSRGSAAKNSALFGVKQ